MNKEFEQLKKIEEIKHVCSLIVQGWLATCDHDTVVTEIGRQKLLTDMERYMTAFIKELTKITPPTQEEDNNGK